MKTKAQIQEELLRIKAKIDEAKTYGKGYDTFSALRADETRIKTLQWVLEEEE